MMDELSLKLNDIKLPDGVSWWPLALGWWILVLVVLVCVGLIYFKYFYSSKKSKLIEYARGVLSEEYALWQRQGNGLIFVQAISVLFRRIALSFTERNQVASLIGKRWLERLDIGLDGKPFELGPGKILQHGPYQSRVDQDMGDLYLLCQRKLDQIEGFKN